MLTENLMQKMTTIWLIKIGLFAHHTLTGVRFGMILYPQIKQTILGSQRQKAHAQQAEADLVLIEHAGHDEADARGDADGEGK